MSDDAKRERRDRTCHISSSASGDRSISERYYRQACRRVRLKYLWEEQDRRLVISLLEIGVIYVGGDAELNDRTRYSVTKKGTRREIGRSQGRSDFLSLRDPYLV